MILRVFLEGPDIAGGVHSWVRYADDGRALQRGRGTQASWPPAARIDAVLAAAAVRMVALRLPPMARSRLRSAAAYALEDQLATPIDESSVAAGPQDEDGRLLAAVASKAAVAAIAAATPHIVRLLPEPALAPIGEGWTWCRSQAGGGFIRRGDGSTLAASDVPGSGALPAEISAALAQAQRGGQSPARVHVAFAQEAGSLALWSEASGVEFVAAPDWQWDHAKPEAFAQAPDLLAGEAEANPLAAVAAGLTLRKFRLPLLLVALALAVHIAALCAQWSWLSIERWRAARALIDLAMQAGLPPETDPLQAARALAGRHAELLHHAAKDAPGDALPLLARAAPPLALLPAGALKSAVYGGGAWTLEFSHADSAALAGVTRSLDRAGVDALVAPLATGARMRLVLDPAAR